MTSVPALFSNRSNLILFMYFTLHYANLKQKYCATKIVYLNFYQTILKVKKRLFVYIIFKIRELI